VFQPDAGHPVGNFPVQHSRAFVSPAFGRN
jgi:hypothetical protein